MGGGVRLVCSTLGPAEGRNPSCARVHSRPLLALGLDKPVLHPHPCKILLVYVANLCIVHFFSITRKRKPVFLRIIWRLEFKNTHKWNLYFLPEYKNYALVILPVGFVSTRVRYSVSCNSTMYFKIITYGGTTCFDLLVVISLRQMYQYFPLMSMFLCLKVGCSLNLSYTSMLMLPCIGAMQLNILNR